MESPRFAVTAANARALRRAEAIEPHEVSYPGTSGHAIHDRALNRR
jgi:hypothetical protein